MVWRLIAWHEPVKCGVCLPGSISKSGVLNIMVDHFNYRRELGKLDDKIKL
jgi:hypothetical protein